MAMSGSKGKAPSPSDLLKIFGVLAEELFTASKVGNILHATKNIRESGDLVEQRFRGMLASRLPFPFQVTNGYLFDTDRNCTPQIDVIISDRTKNHTMFSLDTGTSYSSYTGICALGEIKTKARGILSSMTQFKKILAAYRGMDLTLRSNGLGHKLHETIEPLSFIIVCDSCKITDKTIISNYGKICKNHLPDFFILLNSCKIIIPAAALDVLNVDDMGKTQTPQYMKQSGHWKIMKSENMESLLLWFFYYVISHLYQSYDDKNPIGEFAKWTSFKIALSEISRFQT